MRSWSVTLFLVALVGVPPIGRWERRKKVLPWPIQRSYVFMQSQPARKILDVGCGPGMDTVALDLIVGSTGQVFGVDYDAQGVFFNSASMTLIGGRKA